MTPRTILDFQSPGIQDRAKFSSLYDSHEFMAVASQLSQTVSPSRRPSTKTGGSELYDSFELRAVAKQLNMAMKAAQNGTPLYQDPRCLDYLYKRKAKSMKQLAKPNEKIYGKAGEENKRGPVLALWKKLKRAINPQ
ncbi:hypothetical protein J5N97_010271 [Dioscorea zingiberensis]|uniref:Uncharacterized protein n=1 Tax=Dioscorea zingiberensis TaxID=325984 RepID=A0A9D5CY26_9LILI|nr:hypothetical protein J5N97_010250 [Dioscorea zingiberensis]KAJ0982016.1 hypothetical protein J5N97_010271 [Dioscorea zingiberensis]